MRNQSSWCLQQEAKDLNQGRNVWVFNHGVPEVKEMHLGYTGVFALCMSLFYLPVVLFYRIFIWKAQSVFWMLSECDKAGEKTGAEIRPGLPQM